MRGKPTRRTKGMRRMLFTYWAARCLDDSAAYNIRAETRAAAERERSAAVAAGHKFGPVARVDVAYDNRMDFVRTLLGEGGAESLLP